MSGNSERNIKQDANNITLVMQAKEGSEAAFSQLYDAYFEKIYKYIYFRVNHKEIAEDLAEEVFTKSWIRIATVKPESFGGWLYSIAKNLIIDYYRQKKQVVDLEGVENILESDENLAEDANTVIERKLFLKLLKELTPEQQIIIKLKFLEDLDNSEISELISKSEGAIRVIQHRAILRLQELIKEHTDSIEENNEQKRSTNQANA